MKKYNIFTKTVLASSIAMISGLSISAMAAGPMPTPTPTPNPQGVAIISQLGKLHTDLVNTQKRMQAIAEAQDRAKVFSQYQQDPSITDAMLLNAATAKANTVNETSVAKATSQAVATKFSYLPDHLLTPGPWTNYNSQLSSDERDQSNAIQNMTMGIPASDSIYSLDPSLVSRSISDPQLKSQFRPGTGLAKPSTDGNENFDYTNLIQPVSYTPDQQSAAENYVKFAMKNYSFPGKYINTQKFVNYVQGKSPKDQLQAYASLMNSDAYRNFQIKQRSSMTTTTLALNNLEHLITERTPVKDLGTQAGLKDDKGNAIADASPLQVEQYRATRRVNDPKWFAHVQSESPAAVQRESLVVLAEIEAQLYQAHIDRERQLGIQAVQVANASGMSDMMLRANSNDINKVIDQITNQKDSDDYTDNTHTAPSGGNSQPQQNGGKNKKGGNN